MRRRLDLGQAGWWADRRTVLVALVLVFTARGNPATAKGLPGKWVEVRSAHFTVVGNAEPEEVREIAKQLEQVRLLYLQVLPEEAQGSAPPLRVLAARNEGTMKFLLPEYWSRGGSVHPAGVFISHPAYDQVALRADLGRSGDFSVVFHEYFHYLTRLAGWKLPTWASEGMATFWGNTRFERKATEVGRPSEGWIRVLRAGYRLPVEEVVVVNGLSGHYQDSVKAQRFYARSWALVHYLVLGDETGQRRAQFEQYLQRVQRSEPSLETAREVFGDLDELDRELSHYTRKFLFPYVQMTPAPDIPDDQLTTRRLSEAEAAAVVSRFLVGRRTPDDVEALVAVALEGAADLVDSQVAAARWHMAREENDKARMAFERAAELPGAGDQAHYGFAILTLAVDSSPEAMAVAERELRKALEINPGYAPARARLSWILHRREPCSPQSLSEIREAQKLWKSSAGYLLKEAEQLRECGQKEATDEVLGRLIDEALASESPFYANGVCWSASLQGFATEILGVCDRAVELAPDEWWIRDSRAVARLVVGDLDGARSDLEVVLSEAESDWENRGQRVRWLASLTEGVNLLVGTELNDLRLKEAGVGWGL